MASFAKDPQYGRAVLHTWVLTTADPVGDPIEWPGAADRVVQVIATNFGSATCVFEGSLVRDSVTDGDYFTLTDGQGNAISFTADGGELVSENTLMMRPRLSVVGTAADITVRLLSRSTMS